MEHAYGWLSVLPPIIAIVLALVTKEVLGSLIIGIFSGYFIFVNFAPPEIAEGLMSTNPILGPFLEMVSAIVANAGDSWNMAILMFLGILGGLVAVVSVAGGSRAYAEWAATKIKNKVGAQLATLLLGCLIFIDDYFNTLTVGTVMKPVTDMHRVSRAKLAYLLDSTAAPVTILVPVSSWVATILSIMGPSFAEEGLDMTGLEGFMATIPFNIYPWLTLLMIVLLAVWKFDFGPMAKFEKIAEETGELQGSNNITPPGDDFAGLEVSEKGTPWDLIVPVIGLVIFTIIAMMFTGGYFDGGISFAEALGATDAATSLLYGSIGAIILSLIMFVPRKLMTYGQFMNAFAQGVKSMVPAFMILILAWTFGGVLRDGGLQTGSFVSAIVADAIPIMILPALIFIISGLIAFSTGTSWGTFAIMLPIAISVCTKLNPEMMGVFMAAVLAGAVYGDHCSPISDTTIMSSTGASCHHLDHVTTQMPYATLVAGVSLVGFVVAGATNSAVLSMGVSVVLLVVILRVLANKAKKA